jgi:Leucine-rich repeat (LRR) protein
MLDGCSTFLKMEKKSVSIHNEPLKTIPLLNEFIQDLTIDNCQLCDFRGLELYVNLKSVRLSRNEITDVSRFPTLSNLVNLNLGCNNISRMNFSCSFPKVIQLDLYGNKIHKIENLKLFPELRILNLRNNCISRIENLYQVPKLNTLYLENNQIHKLKGINKIQEITIDNNPLLYFDECIPEDCFFELYFDNYIFKIDLTLIKHVEDSYLRFGLI